MFKFLLITQFPLNFSDATLICNQWTYTAKAFLRYVIRSVITTLLLACTLNVGIIDGPVN